MSYFPVIVICTHTFDRDLESLCVLKVWLQSDGSSQECGELKTLQSWRVCFNIYLNKEFCIEKKMTNWDITILLHWLQNEAEEYMAEWHYLQELPILSLCKKLRRNLNIFCHVSDKAWH